MASTSTQGLPHNFILTPQQQSLLYRALTSNQTANGSPPAAALSVSPTALKQTGPSKADSVQESPFQDYDYDFGSGPDSSFDFEFANGASGQMIGDLPNLSPGNDSNDSSKATSPENDSAEKRSYPDEDEGDREESGNKRRESEGKVPKKPGRKPLTNEPSSKRKAQNRAAQRAFRERKEQHLKDLETKVKELEEASATTHNENSQLRAQVEKMTMELNEYKKRLSLPPAPHVTSGPSPQQNFSRGTFGAGLVNTMNDVNFQFEFPKFGLLPGPSEGTSPTTGSKAPKRTTSASSSTTANGYAGQSSPSTQDQATPSSTKSRENSTSQSKGVSNQSPYEVGGNASRTSLDSTNFSVGGTASTSPSSSHSNGGPSSSCGTSPEPFTQSPLGFKPVDTLTTIGEEQPALTVDNGGHMAGFGSFDFTNFDWLANQNGGQFDPQLFGDYREPQDNILANTTFDDSFFNDAFDADFITPYNVAPASPKAPKKNICAEIDARKEDEDTIVTAENGKLMTCTNIWEQLQNCPKVQAGDIDLDGLCSDLQKKAKCGGTGAVVDETDFKAVMKKHLGVSGSQCPGN
ncbi:transcription factor PAP1-domain-containing protein [Apiospora saccharicola]|uniref:Transcription factor PAP1-domain-containing protein n=1 Tax=Apiospora saccharicola TaxID=335842 RepID=A0ABR1U4U6_9PEZI